MNKTFDYFYVQEAMDSITIEDIGNCVIEASGDSGFFYYLIIKTAMGITRILEYGPYKDGGFPTYVDENFIQMDYNEKKITQRIDKFLKHPDITQVRQLNSIDEIKDRLVDMLTYFDF